MRSLRSPLLCLVALALVTSACTGDDDTTSDTGPNDTGPNDTGPNGAGPNDTTDDTPPDALDGEGLTIGLVRAPTGLFDLLGAAQVGALQLAAADVAAGGGVLGGPLTITVDQPTPERDVETVFDELVDGGTNLIVGPSSSEEARVLIPKLADADAIVCGASTTAPGLTELPGADGRFVRTAFDDNIVVSNTFDRIRERTASVLGREPRITIAARGDAYGDAVTSALASLLDLVGNQVTIDRYEPRDIIAEGLGDRIAATQPDVVVLIALEEGPSHAKQIVEAGVDPAALIGLDGLATPRLVGKANLAEPNDLDGMTVIGTTGPVSFMTQLLAQPESQEEVLYGAQAYDCAVAFALAVEAAQSTDADEVSTALRDVTGGGTICTTYAQCAELLRAGEDIDYDGPSGQIDLTPEGEPGGGRFITARVADGELRVVADLRIALEEIRDRIAPRLAGFIGDIQVALTELGYYTGPIDGRQSDELTAAIAAFQTDAGLEPTGQLDAATIAAIQEALAERGAILGASIQEVQLLLTELGYYTGPIDGRWSDELSAAIAAFQTDLGVEPTGILDAATLRAIYEAGVAAGQPVEPPPTTTVPSTTVPDTTTTVPDTTVPDTTTTAPATPVSAIDVLAADPRFSLFASLLTPPVLQAIPQLEDPAAQITVFAPNDDALIGIDVDPAGLSQQEIIDLISFHVVDEALADTDLATGDYPTLLDQGDGPVPVTIEATSPPTIGGIVFVAQSLPTTGGFVYSLNGVLTAP